MRNEVHIRRDAMIRTAVATLIAVSGSVVLSLVATSVLMIDLDHFKDINDKFGHDFGDAALVHIAAIIRDMALSKGSVVGRRGGEEFVVLMPDVVHADALAFAERVRAACAIAPL